MEYENKRFVLRLSTDLKQKLDAVATNNSAYIRDSIELFLARPERPFPNRARVKGMANRYTTICIFLNEEQVERARKKYPDISLSVLTQTALSESLAHVKSSVDETKQIESDEGKQEGEHLAKIPKVKLADGRIKKVVTPKSGAQVPTMLTKVTADERAKYKAAYQLTSFATLRSFHASMLEEFLRAKPWKKKEFVWSLRDSKEDFVIYNIVVDESLQSVVKSQAVELDVSLSVVLKTALDWYTEKLEHERQAAKAEKST